MFEIETMIKTGSKETSKPMTQWSRWLGRLDDKIKQSRKKLPCNEQARRESASAFYP
jgi:hypothetical protein